ncbi:MAG: hypothetical protein GJ680_18420 [Alteromonadaceae bacterium]|nr:hypothetical protein [Alteromonadaceae bacterium]
MSEIDSNTATDELSKTESDAKLHALISYGMMALGIFTGIFWFVGAFWAMVKKGDAENTIFHSHYKNLIKTFWVCFALAVVGFITSVFIIGYFILVGSLLFAIYRLIKGFSLILLNKAYD